MRGNVATGSVHRSTPTLGTFVIVGFADGHGREVVGGKLNSAFLVAALGLDIHGLAF